MLCKISKQLPTSNLCFPCLTELYSPKTLKSCFTHTLYSFSTFFWSNLMSTQLSLFLNQKPFSQNKKPCVNSESLSMANHIFAIRTSLVDLTVPAASIPCLLLTWSPFNWSGCSCFYWSNFKFLPQLIICFQFSTDHFIVNCCHDWFLCLFPIASCSTKFVCFKL